MAVEETVRSGPILDIATGSTEGLDVGFQSKDYKMSPGVLAPKCRCLFGVGVAGGEAMKSSRI